MAASSHRTLFLNADINYVAGILRDYNFQNYTHFSLKSELPSYNNGVTFRFSNSVSFTSWGEDIIITMFPDYNGSLHVDISSECSMPTQIIDWGKNEENLNKISSYLYNYCQQQAYTGNGYPQQNYSQNTYPQQNTPYVQAPAQNSYPYAQAVQQTAQPTPEATTKKCPH